jgi:hypothetical protein
MNSIFHSLIWKDWHEQKWKLAALVATLFGVAMCLLINRGADTFTTIRITLGICIVPLAIFVGLNSAAGERSTGTLPFLQALPIPLWRVALHKFVAGLVTVVASVLLTLLIIYVAQKGLTSMGVEYYSVRMGGMSDGGFSFQIRDWFLDSGLVLSVLAVSFYVWSAATGVNRKDEISAGAVALVIMVVWCLVVTYISYWILRLGELPHNSVANWAAWSVALAAATVPGGLLSTRESTWLHQINFIGIGVVVAAATHLALAAWYIWRFGRISNVEVHSPQPIPRSTERGAWLGPPRRSAFTAIAWKQARESGPILLAGLAGVVAIVGAVFVSVWIDRGDATPSIRDIGDVYRAVAIVLGFVMSLVIGIGVAFYDVRPQINTFWRSRPINPNTWFWCKYITAMAVLLATIYVPILLIAGLGATSRQEMMGEPIVIALAQIALCSAAVATTCVFRNAIYAAILSIPVLYLGVILVWVSLLLAKLVGWQAHAPNRFWDMSSNQVAVGLTLSIAASAILAWLAVRNDWGRKSRY